MQTFSESVLPVYTNEQCSLTKTFFTVTFNLSFAYSTVVPAKSGSDVMFCLQSIRDLESTGHLFINPIGLIHKRSFDSR